MERIGVRLVARATVALCLAACVTGVAPAAGAKGGETIAQAPSVKLEHARCAVSCTTAPSTRASPWRSWTASFTKGDRITIRTTASGGDTPPCQILFMPGTDDTNVGATTPILNPASRRGDGSHDVQRLGRRPRPAPTSSR